MSRKGSYGAYYKDDYDVYDDYDDDFDSDVEDIGKGPQKGRAANKNLCWRCPICTYDNAEALSSCDICGVIRHSAIKSSPNVHSTVNHQSNGCGASLMAKSLFATDEFAMPNGYFPSFRGDRNIGGNFHDFQEAFNSTVSNGFVNIAVPFNFQSPSPDDQFSMKHSLVSISKGDSVQSMTPHVNSDTAEAQLNPNGTDHFSHTSPIDVRDNSIRSTYSVSSDDKTQELNNILHNVKLEDNRELSRNFVDSKITAQTSSSYKPEKWMLPHEGELCSLNLAIVGHVDSGKSTMAGRMLHLLGHISQKDIHKYEKEAALKGKSSFSYAWALDESSEERERGITMTVAVAYLNSRKYRISLLDSPGHRDFIPNLISGSAQADAAILVIDASVGSFEAGIGQNETGQTKEHAQLVRSFGVDQLIVAINKMDVVMYSKERFDIIKTQLASLLRTCGFKETNVSWIPMSAMENQNLVVSPSSTHLSSWYEGPCLLDAIDSLRPPTRDTLKPLRMPICDIVRSRSLLQLAASGKLESGAIKVGGKVLVMPSGILAIVRSIEYDSSTCTVARAGDNVVVSLQGIDTGHIMPGGVLCHPDFPVSVASRLELKVITLETTMPILIGSQVEFHVHHAKEAARVVRILSILDQKTGKVSKNAPRLLTAKQSAVIEISLEVAICVEKFSDCRSLGRVCLRASGKTIAVGIITQVMRPEK